MSDTATGEIALMIGEPSYQIVPVPGRILSARLIWGDTQTKLAEMAPHPLGRDAPVSHLAGKTGAPSEFRYAKDQHSGTLSVYPAPSRRFREAKIRYTYLPDQP